MKLPIAQIINACYNHIRWSKYEFSNKYFHDNKKGRLIMEFLSHKRLQNIRIDYYERI